MHRHGLQIIAEYIFSGQRTGAQNFKEHGHAGINARTIFVGVEHVLDPVVRVT